MTAFSLPFASDASPSPLLEMLRMAGTLRRRLTSASGRSLCLCSPPGYLGHRGCGTQKSTGNFVGGSSALRKSMLTGRGGGEEVGEAGRRSAESPPCASVRSVRSVGFGLRGFGSGLCAGGAVAAWRCLCHPRSGKKQWLDLFVEASGLVTWFHMVIIKYLSGIGMGNPNRPSTT